MLLLLFRQERAEYQKSAKRTAVERAARLQAQLDKQAAEAADVADGKTPTSQDDKTSEMAKELERTAPTPSLKIQLGLLLVSKGEDFIKRILKGFTAPREHYFHRCFTPYFRARAKTDFYTH